MPPIPLRGPAIHLACRWPGAVPDDSRPSDVCAGASPPHAIHRQWTQVPAVVQELFVTPVFTTPFIAPAEPPVTVRRRGRYGSDARRRPRCHMPDNVRAARVVGRLRWRRGTEGAVRTSAPSYCGAGDARSRTPIRSRGRRDPPAARVVRAAASRAGLAEPVHWAGSLGRFTGPVHGGFTDRSGGGWRERDVGVQAEGRSHASGPTFCPSVNSTTRPSGSRTMKIVPTISSMVSMAVGD